MKTPHSFFITAAGIISLLAPWPQEFLLFAQDSSIRPFSIEVDDAVLEDLSNRLTQTRWPAPTPVVGWEYGVDLSYMKDLVAHWRSNYDWRVWEKKLNAFDQFKTEIDGLDLHFIHVRSPHADAVPLLLVHGWPGSVFEFHKIIGPLTEPEKHGGRAEDAFHVVAPSLPGFGFSEAPGEPGWSVSRMAAVVPELMERLGYDHYGAQGGDWGAGVVRWLGTYDSDHVLGIHINFPRGTPPPGQDRWKGVSPEERQRWEKRRRELAGQKAYAAIQGTRPQTLGLALNDSPAGLAAWITDKFWAWSDHSGNLDNSFSQDELLTNIMIYWTTGTAPTSARIYFERDQYTGGRDAGSVPVGVALFPKEINVPPRAWIEARYGDRLVHFTRMPRGGHFAAMEEPELLINDIRSFFSKLR
jgi:pimeloyl-ACP methyl ester carboxylesterase